MQLKILQHATLAPIFAEKSARSFFCTKFLLHPPGLDGCPRVRGMDVRAPSACFPKVQRACLKLLTQDVRTNDPGTSAGHRARKRSLRAALADPFLRRFREGISFPNFVERSVLKPPLSKLCGVRFALQKRAVFEGEQRAKKVPRKGMMRGGQHTGQREKV